MSFISNILLIVLPVTFLVFAGAILFDEAGIWEDLKYNFNSLKEHWVSEWVADKIIPEVSLGRDELNSQFFLSDEKRDSIGDLSRTIQRMLDSQKNNCFMDYGELPELEQNRIFFSKNADGTVMTVMGGSGGDQILTEFREEFSEMQPCVIAAETRVTDNFYGYFIALGSSRHEINMPPFYPYTYAVDTLTMASNGVRSQNRIDYGMGFKDMKSHGLLFTPDNRRICFFPTEDVSAGGSGRHGINSRFFGEDVGDLPQVIQTRGWEC